MSIKSGKKGDDDGDDVMVMMTVDDVDTSPLE